MGTGVGIVIDNAGTSGAYSSQTGMRLGFSLRNIATARANVAKTSSLTHDEVMASAWREWNSAMSRLQVLDDPSTPAMQRELGLFYSTLYHSMKKPTDWTKQVAICIKHDDLCIKYDDFCINNDVFCIINDGLCITYRTDWSKQVPPQWTFDGQGATGYVFDLGTMWDQYKCLLPLIVPAPGNVYRNRTATICP